MMNNYIIEASSISKSYGSNLVLNDISFTCKKGDAVAFVGPNGCGKSTLLRILSGLTPPTSGQLNFCDEEIKIAFIPDHYEKINIKTKTFFNHVMDIYQCIDHQERLDDLIKEFQLESMLDTQLKHLSKGSLQKVAIIQALICDSDLLFMDEPLSGQDIQSEQYFIEQIHQLKKRGASIILATHDDELVTEIADTVFSFENGRIHKRVEGKL